jgi:Kef-type K+ transport system membrane component KefB
MHTATHSSESLLFSILVQLAIIVAVSRLAGSCAVRIGQSRAVGEIIVGIMLGPSLFGALAPGAFALVFRSASPEPLTVLSQIGLILLMFQIGMEFDFSHIRVRNNRSAVLWIAGVGVLLPFILGVGFAQLSHVALASAATPIVYSLFIGLALAITAVPILGRIMIELDLQRTPLGCIAISAAALNDVIGWLLLALVSTLATASFSTAAFAVKVLLLALFGTACVLIIRPLLGRVADRVGHAADPLPNNLLCVILCAVFLAALCTYQLGVFAILGGFVLGVLLHDRPALVAAWRARVGAFVEVFFLPIFFTFTGLRTDIGALNTGPLWGWCALLFALATFGKMAGCYWAARGSGLDSREAGAIGIMMNTRALMELVVINIGYELHVIPGTVFTMLVLMAIGSTVITMPALKWWLFSNPRAVESLAAPLPGRD